MTNPSLSKRCIVEGPDTSAVVIALLRRYTNWPQKSDDAPVYILPESSINSALKHSSLIAEFQATGRTATGLVVDAEQDRAAVWRNIRAFATARFNEVPEELPNAGLILVDNEGRRFGLWLMPDNQSNGMLEDFVRVLVPDHRDPLWAHAVDSVAKARAELGAPCKDVHVPKAHIHAWLSFQNPPGLRMGPAISNKILDPEGNRAEPFIRWFTQLFEVEHL